MKNISKYLIVLTVLSIFISCSKDDDSMDPMDNNQNPELEFGLGAIDTETSDDIPTGIYFGNGDLPTSYDISQFLPPVGNQGQFGTCVSWALGYNLKTIIEAQDKNYSSSDLTDPNLQASPKDLFLAIPKDETAPSCAGTYLSSALDVMQNRGVATMAYVPYTGLGDCSQSTQSSWDQEASGYKIDSYRSLNIDVVSIKQQIASDKPVGFGARLGDNFMSWDSDQVLSGHTSFDRVGIHAGHAMTVIGYDDNKGANGAFRAINSWGENWGSQGFIWIDYDFFVSGDFCSVAYTASNSTSDVNPNNPTNPTSNGNIDLIPYGLGDNAINPSVPTSRELSYNVFNVGTESAKASSDWAISYLYYNAYDANDFGILLHDYYTDDFNAPGQNGDMGSGPGSSGNWWNHVDVPGNASISQAVLGTQENFTWSYQLPNLTGYYYLVMIADTYDVLNDKDKDNNYYYMTDEFGWPIYFDNGIPSFMPEAESTDVKSATTLSSAQNQSPELRSEGNKNAYTKKEITNMIINLKKNGKLKKAVTQFKNKKK